MRLHTYFRSSAACRVRIALNLKGIAYEPVAVDCDLTSYPTLRAVSGYLEALPEFARAVPAAQPDAG